MSFFSKLFGSKRNAPTDVEGQLKKLEVEAENALPGYVGSSFNRAGDLALRDGQADRAVGYYGRAIDAFLEDAQREAARGVANKIIRVRPSAVRTLSTLTWLDLAARHQATALLHLRDYTAAAAEADEQKRAATQIYAMARVSDDSEFLGAAADALDSLGFVNRAKEVRSWTKTGAPEAVEDAAELGRVCLEAAVRSNDPDATLLVDELDSEESGDEADRPTREDDGGSEAGHADGEASEEATQDEAPAVEDEEPEEATPDESPAVEDEDAEEATPDEGPAVEDEDAEEATPDEGPAVEAGDVEEGEDGDEAGAHTADEAGSDRPVADARSHDVAAPEAETEADDDAGHEDSAVASEDDTALSSATEDGASGESRDPAAEDGSGGKSRKGRKSGKSRKKRRKKKR